MWHGFLLPGAWMSSSSLRVPHTHGRLTAISARLCLLLVLRRALDRGCVAVACRVLANDAAACVGRTGRRGRPSASHCTAFGLWDRINIKVYHDPNFVAMRVQLHTAIGSQARSCETEKIRVKLLHGLKIKAPSGSKRAIL